MYKHSVPFMPEQIDKYGAERFIQKIHANALHRCVIENK